MKIATWNVNSLKVRQERLLEWLGAKQPDVVCLQELKLETDKFPYESIQSAGYHAVVLGQKTYNGVAILARSALKDIAYGFGDGDPDTQSRFIAATTDNGISICCGYFPNGESLESDKYVYKRAWLERLRQYLEQTLSQKKSLLLCGDFNIAPAPFDVHDEAVWEATPHYSPEMRQAFIGLLNAGLIDVVRQHYPEKVMFSWWDYRQLAFPFNRGLRIDHILATPDLATHCTAAGIDREARKGKQPSDHAPVWADFEV